MEAVRPAVEPSETDAAGTTMMLWVSGVAAGASASAMTAGAPCFPGGGGGAVPPVTVIVTVVADPATYVPCGR